MGFRTAPLDLSGTYVPLNYSGGKALQVPVLSPWNPLLARTTTIYIGWFSSAEGPYMPGIGTSFMRK